jgi:hypothetical protein
MTRPGLPFAARSPPQSAAPPAAPIRGEPCGDAWVMVDWGTHVQANIAARALEWLRAVAPEALGWQAPAGGHVVLPAPWR